MLKKTVTGSRITCILKYLLFSYLFTAGLLLLLALMLYRFSLSEKMVSISILIIYVLITFLAGFIMGKHEGSRKFLWGLLMGSLYFLILAAVSCIVNHGFQDVGVSFLTTLMLCTGGGMLGGMLS